MANAKRRPLVGHLVGGFAWCATLLLVLGSLCPLVSPERLSWLGVVGLAFPFLVALALLALALALLLAPRTAWVVAAGLALCLPAMRTYCPVNFPSTPPKGSLKVLTYNTANFGHAKRDAAGRNAVAAYVAESGADIVCMQEGSTVPPAVYSDEVLPTLRQALPHVDSVNIANNIFVCASRFPIVSKEVVCRNLTNGAAAFRLLLAPGDTLLVVNCHLESMHLSPDDRARYHSMVMRPEEADVEGSSRLLARKVATAAVARARQADQVHRYVERHLEGGSVLVCGDFNDTPLSYTRHRVAQGLTDAFRATATGVGRTFNRDAIYVRIDHILCSRDWKPYAAHVDRSTKLSDHYPVVAYIKRK